jgi:hypothetical protein
MHDATLSDVFVKKEKREIKISLTESVLFKFNDRTF